MLVFFVLEPGLPFTVSKPRIINMAELTVVSDAEFRAAMNVFGFSIPEQHKERGREVALFTKTVSGKAIGQPS